MRGFAPARAGRRMHKAFDEVQHRQTRRVVLDAIETLQQAQRVRLGEERARRLLGRVVGVRGRGAVEQRRNGHREHIGDLRQAARADAVRAFSYF